MYNHLMGLLIGLAAIVYLVYALYRATKKRGYQVLCFFAAACSFLNALGIFAEKLWGPQWSWNLSNQHGLAFAASGLAEAIVFLALGLSLTASRNRHIV
jgi:hypothetical protein